MYLREKKCDLAGDYLLVGGLGLSPPGLLKSGHCAFTSFSRRLFAVTGPAAWNSFSRELRRIPAVSTFKQHLKT